MQLVTRVGIDQRPSTSECVYVCVIVSARCAPAVNQNDLCHFPPYIIAAIYLCYFIEKFIQPYLQADIIYVHTYVHKHIDGWLHKRS